MTINIAIAVSEGLVMAADSLSQMSSKGGTISTLHQSVEKITEIRGRPIALMINGLGEIRKRTIISLIREFEFDQYAIKGAPIRNWTVEEFTSHLTSFIAHCYNEAYQIPTVESGSRRSRPVLGIIVGGYSPRKFFPEVFEIAFPGGNWERLFPKTADALHPREYIDFWGQTTALVRLLYGYDGVAIDDAQELTEKIEVLRQGGVVDDPDMRYEELPEEYRSLPPPLKVNLVASLMSLGRWIRMQTRLNGMPLQEAVEFAEYLGNVAVGYDRFKTGLPAVGGELDVVAIQPEGLHWYKRKPFLQKMADARDAALTQQERVQFREALGTLEALATSVEGTGPTQLRLLEGSTSEATPDASTPT